jgi:hypothetical protein
MPTARSENTSGLQTYLCDGTLENERSTRDARFDDLSARGTGTQIDVGLTVEYPHYFCLDTTFTSTENVNLTMPRGVTSSASVILV